MVSTSLSDSIKTAELYFTSKAIQELKVVLKEYGTYTVVLFIIGGQCRITRDQWYRTEPWCRNAMSDWGRWPAEEMPMPDWTLMPECRCRTEAADYRKKCRCRTNFSPAFRHLQMIFQCHTARIAPSVAVYGRAGCITFYYLQFGREQLF
jgi:hypothetical protein